MKLKIRKQILPLSWISAMMFLLIFSESFAQENEVDPNGYNVFYYENGEKSSEGNMVDGKPDGYWKNYHPNGNLKSEGNRIEFELDSIWKFYDENGILTKEINYEDGKRNGETKRYTKEGFLVAKEYYENDKREGEASYFYETGELHRRVFYENDKIEGLVYEYDKSGRIITLERYSKGNLRSSEKINRFNTANQKIGTWKEFYDNMQVKEEGYYVRGKRNGVFKYYKKDGTLENMLMFNNGELVEDAEETVMLDIRTIYKKDGGKLVGGFKDGIRHGVFREYDENNNLTHSLVYKDGKIIGEGLVNQQGFKEGDWIHYYDTGEKYSEGIYDEGMRDGKWTFYFKNGQVLQTGFYVNDEPDGEWNWYFEDGSLLRKEFYRNGLEDGPSVEYNPKGEVVIKGEYIDGRKEGEWFYQMGTHTQRGEFVDDRKHGVWVHHFNIDKEQISFEGEFIDGNPNGEHIYYHENGRVKLEAYYEMGRKVNRWRRYDENGVPTLTIQYKNGEIYKIDGRKFEVEN